jgi:Protein of unknown function (DUF1360)
VTPLDLLIGSVATWRITHMLLLENGPFRVFRRLRERFGVVYGADDDTQVVSFKYEITTCPWCLSIWVATAATLLLRWSGVGRWVLLPFISSAGSVIIGKLMERKLQSFSEFKIQ